MSLRRIGILVEKEFKLGLGSFMFILAIVMPVVLTLVMSLLFGTLFTDSAKMGVYDAGSSDFADRAGALGSLDVTIYESEGALRNAVEIGREDVGLALPIGFDQTLQSGEEAELSLLVFGESQLKDRTLAATALIGLLRDIAGQEPPVEIVTITLGDAESLPWEIRLMPFLVMIAVLIGGLMMPATSLVEEKLNRTLKAVGTTSAALSEIYTAKVIAALIVSTVMGVFILVMNRALGREPLLLILVLASGSVFAAVLGLLMGIVSKDVNSLFTMIKGLGIFLYAPALVYMFPEIPAWIGKIFPTYYIIQPVMDIIQDGAGWMDVLPNLGILAALTAALAVGVGVVSERKMQSI